MGRARRSFMLSMGLLLVGFIAIGAALVYRSTRDGGNNGSEYVIAAMRIPAGAQVVSVTAADGLLTLTYKAGPMTSVRIFDGRSGEMIREVPVVSD